MSEPIKPKVLLEITKLLFRRSDDAVIWLDVIEAVLIKHGLVSHDEMAALFQQMKAEYVARIQKTISEVSEQQQSEQLLELLRSFEGKPQ